MINIWRPRVAILALAAGDPSDTAPAAGADPDRASSRRKTLPHRAATCSRSRRHADNFFIAAGGHRDTPAIDAIRQHAIVRLFLAMSSNILKRTCLQKKYVLRSL